MSSQRRLETIEGHVDSASVARGTASQHSGLVLTTPDGEELILQRVGGNPFRDAVTQELSGQDVSLEGFRLGKVFRFVRANVTSLA